ncbi:hypothetical protein LCGC14_3092340, partial [marine sediment metagenome]
PPVLPSALSFPRHAPEFRLLKMSFFAHCSPQAYPDTPSHVKIKSTIRYKKVLCGTIWSEGVRKGTTQGIGGVPAVVKIDSLTMHVALFFPSYKLLKAFKAHNSGPLSGGACWLICWLILKSNTTRLAESIALTAEFGWLICWLAVG